MHQMNPRKKHISTTTPHHHPQHFLKQLSLSFYPNHIINNHKQVILDSCIFQEGGFDFQSILPTIKSLSKKYKQRCTKSKIVDGCLRIDDYFSDAKVDYIQMVTTNASHLQDVSEDGKGGKSSIKKRRAVSARPKNKQQEGQHKRCLLGGCRKRKGSSCISIAKKK